LKQVGSLRDVSKILRAANLGGEKLAGSGVPPEFTESTV
jgi:hypothetical protein